MCLKAGISGKRVYIVFQFWIHIARMNELDDTVIHSQAGTSLRRCPIGQRYLWVTYSEVGNCSELSASHIWRSTDFPLNDPSWCLTVWALLRVVEYLNWPWGRIELAVTPMWTFQGKSWRMKARSLEVPEVFLRRKKKWKQFHNSCSTAERSRLEKATPEVRRNFHHRDPPRPLPHHSIISQHLPCTS